MLDPKLDNLFQKIIKATAQGPRTQQQILAVLGDSEEIKEGVRTLLSRGFLGLTLDWKLMIKSKDHKTEGSKMKRPYLGQIVIVHARMLKPCCRPAVVILVLDDDMVDLSLLSGGEIELEYANVPRVGSDYASPDDVAAWTAAHE